MPDLEKNPSPFIAKIGELYRMEVEDEYRVETLRTVSFNFPVEDACMLAAIAKRFGRSTAAFGGELFAQHVRELFIALSPEDRKALAAEADAEAVRYLQSKGITRSSDGVTGWASYADICDRVEAGEAFK